MRAKIGIPHGDVIENGKRELQYGYYELAGRIAPVNAVLGVGLKICRNSETIIVTKASQTKGFLLY